MIRGDVQLPNGFVCDVDTQAVIYPVAMPKLPDRLREDTRNAGFEFQRHPHLTLISRREGGRLSLKQFMSLSDVVGAAKAPFIQTTEQVWAIRKDKKVGEVTHPRQALVVPCLADDLSVLYESLVQFGIGLGQKTNPDDDLRPFWHLTLASKGDEDLQFKGIGIRTIADWTKLKRSQFYVDFKTQKLYGVPLAA